ncbi:RES family NAD+ phosphorylase [Stutzerimonas tarimensis]|uniref:RES family NAD+ phosphorylase n=1 Tax=Stutzerimonas tarimensis TaxID=1507735 RepID=A0ABV7T2M3_9GAMM
MQGITAGLKSFDTIELNHDTAWRAAYRIIASAFPPIRLFEDVLDPSELEVAYAIESLTNERLLEEAGVIERVPAHDRISGPGSSPVMAAFTHIGRQSRFTDGTYGVYYCASSESAAIAETRFHRERFLAATGEGPLEITMRTYVNQVVQPLHDVRSVQELHSPDPASYPAPQRVGRELRDAGSWGVLYRSVRAPGHECAAVFRPPALSTPTQGRHLRYVWDGSRISHVLQVSCLG